MCPDTQRAGTQSLAPTEEGLRTHAAAPGCPTEWERHVHFFPSAAVTGLHKLSGAKQQFLFKSSFSSGGRKSEAGLTGLKSDSSRRHLLRGLRDSACPVPQLPELPAFPARGLPPPPSGLMTGQGSLAQSRADAPPHTSRRILSPACLLLPGSPLGPPRSRTITSPF